MDHQFLTFINMLIIDVLHSPAFINLNEVKKEEFAQKLQKHFYNTILFALSDQIPAEDLYNIQKTSIVSIDSEGKLSKIVAQMPYVVEDLEYLLVQEAEKIKNNPILIT